MRVSLSSTKANKEVNIFNRDLIELDNKIFDTVDCLVMNPLKSANHKNSYEKDSKTSHQGTKKQNLFLLLECWTRNSSSRIFMLCFKKDTLFITIFL